MASTLSYHCENYIRAEDFAAMTKITLCSARSRSPYSMERSSVMSIPLAVLQTGYRIGAIPSVPTAVGQ